MSVIELIDKAIEKYQWQFRPLSLEVIEDLKTIRNLLEPKEEIKLESKKQEPKPIKQEQAEQTIDDLRKDYEDKFGKKPFMWWDKEVLLSKLK